MGPANIWLSNHLRKISWQAGRAAEIRLLPTFVAVDHPHDRNLLRGEAAPAAGRRRIGLGSGEPGLHRADHGPLDIFSLLVPKIAHAVSNALAPGSGAGPDWRPGQVRSREGVQAVIGGST